jgi:4-hydroxy-tetrahydrodipicolinate synthase
MSFRGIIPPVATPFTESGDLDLPRLRWFIDRLIAGGVHSVFVLGTNSEFYALDDAEKQAVIATAVEHVAGRVPVLAGTGAETTREAERLTRMAEREGVQGVSVITPYFIMPTQNELVDHYRRVAGATKLPLLLYSNPVTCGGLRIEAETAEKLAAVPNIVGIKDSSGDLTLVADLIRRVPSSFAVLQGRDTLIYSALDLGAVGAIPATGNIAPKLLVEIYEKFMAGDRAGSRAAQARLHPLRLALNLCTPPGGVKAALALLGESIGPCRAPIAPLDPSKRPAMEKALREAGLTPAG